MIIHILKAIKRIMSHIKEDFIQRNAFLIVKICYNDIWTLRNKIRNKIINENTWKVKLYYAYMAKYGSWIGIGAQLNTTPILPHGLFGIFISQNAKIGKNVVIFQQVTIGSNTTVGSKNNGSPTIEDNVYIGSGAKIIGNVRIGHNTRIGANCIVVNDVPPNSVVVLSPPRIIIKNETLDNQFYKVGISNN